MKLRRTAATALTVLTVGIVVVLVAGTEPLFAQCSMCRTALEQNAEAARGFNKAILFLLVFPYLLFGGIAAWYIRGRQLRSQAVEAPSFGASAASAD